METADTRSTESWPVGFLCCLFEVASYHAESRMPHGRGYGKSTLSDCAGVGKGSKNTGHILIHAGHILIHEKRLG